MALLLKLLYILLITFSISLIADFLAWKINSRAFKKWWIAVGLSIIMTLLTVTKLQQNSLLFDAEASILTSIHSLKNDFVTASGHQKRISHFIDSNFILINTSNDQALLTAGTGNERITDRKKLLDLFNFLNEQKSKIDLVVVDIIFSRSTSHDAGILKLFDSLRHKLVLAYSKGLINKDTGFYQSLPVSILGDVALVNGEPFYFTHSLLNEDRIPSLPYKMFLKLNDVKEFYFEDGNWLIREPLSTGKFYAFPNYISELYFTNEKRLYSGQRFENEARLPGVSDITVKPSSPSCIYDLGNSITTGGKIQINDLLNSKGDKNKKIVFIGSFRDSYEDKHPTAHGNLYGSTILLNEFYHINKGRHHFSLFRLIGYLLALLAGYFLIFQFLLKAATRKQLSQITAETAGFSQQNFVKNYISVMFHFIMDEIHYVILFVFVIAIDLLFQKIINLMGVLYYVIVFEAFLQLFLNRYFSPPKEMANEKPETSLAK